MNWLLTKSRLEMGKGNRYYNTWNEILNKSFLEKCYLEENKSDSILINVGVDVNKFMPVTWNELNGKYQRWLKGRDNV